jgi:hypothetical protein
MDAGAVSGLEQSWRESHPGSLIGHVNAVLPDRRVLSVTGLPLDQIHAGDVVSILLNGTGSSVVSARVYDKSSGYAQLEYGPLEAGQPTPREGDLAVWYAAGIPGADQSSSAGASNSAIPATQPGAPPEMPAAPGPATPTAPPPETTAPPATPTTPPPAKDASAPPATAPTPPADTTPPPPTNNGAGTSATPPPPGQTPPPPAPDNKLPADLNK